MVATRRTARKNAIKEQQKPAARIMSMLSDDVLHRVISALEMETALKARAVCLSWKTMVAAAGMEPLEAGARGEALTRGLKAQRMLERSLEHEAAVYDQRHCAALAGQMGRQPELNPAMRTIVVSWLIEVHLHFAASEPSLALTLQLLDRFTCASTLSRRSYQTVGVTAFKLAVKTEEKEHQATLADLSYITNYSSSEHQILEMEKKFQTSLCDAIPDSYPTAWRELVVHPTPTDFTTRLVQAAGLEQPVRKRLEQPVETGLEQPVETGLEQPVRSGVAQEEEERHNLHGEEGEHPPGQLAKHAIIRVTESICNVVLNHKIVILLNLEIVGPSNTGLIGTPQPVDGFYYHSEWPAAAAPDTGAADKTETSTNPPSSALPAGGSAVSSGVAIVAGAMAQLTAGAVKDIYVTSQSDNNPGCLLQVLETKRIGLAEDGRERFRVVLSDGVNTCHAMISKNLNHLVLGNQDRAHDWRPQTSRAHATVLFFLDAIALDQQFLGVPPSRAAAAAAACALSVQGRPNWSQKLGFYSRVLEEDGRALAARVLLSAQRAVLAHACLRQKYAAPRMGGDTAKNVPGVFGALKAFLAVERDLSTPG